LFGKSQDTTTKTAITDQDVLVVDIDETKEESNQTAILRFGGKNIIPSPMPDTDGKWTTTRFVDPSDLRHDMHVTIVTLQPGAVIPFCETHVMEHGLYILNGKAVYRLNQDWIEVEAGDYMLLRAFCPQACYAGGPNAFQYLLYKDVNRHMNLKLSNN
jgi:(S)-ureidoglycine aminohydrolase